MSLYIYATLIRYAENQQLLEEIENEKQKYRHTVEILKQELLKKGITPVILRNILSITPAHPFSPDGMGLNTYVNMHENMHENDVSMTSTASGITRPNRRNTSTLENGTKVKYARHPGDIRKIQ